MKSRGLYRNVYWNPRINSISISNMIRASCIYLTPHSRQLYQQDAQLKSTQTSFLCMLNKFQETSVCKCRNQFVFCFKGSWVRPSPNHTRPCGKLCCANHVTTLCFCISGRAVTYKIKYPSSFQCLNVEILIWEYSSDD